MKEILNFEEMEKHITYLPIMLDNFVPNFIYFNKDIKSTAYLKNPTIIISLPKSQKANVNDWLLIYGDLIRVVSNKKMERHIAPQKFLEKVLKMLNHYNQNKTFDNYAEATKDVDLIPLTGKALIFYNGNYYRLPLEYEGADSKLKKTINNIKEDFTKIIFKELCSEVVDKLPYYEDEADKDNLSIKARQIRAEYIKELNLSGDFNFDFGSEFDVDKVVKKILSLKTGSEFHFSDFLPRDIMQDYAKAFETVAEIKKKLKGEIESKEKGMLVYLKT